MPSSRSRAQIGRLERQLIESAARERAGAMVRALGLDPLAPFGGLEHCPTLADFPKPAPFRRALIALALRRAGFSRLRPLVIAESGGGPAARIYRDALLGALRGAADELHLCAGHWQRERWQAPPRGGVVSIARRTVDRHLAGWALGTIAKADEKALIAQILPPDLLALETDVARRARIPIHAEVFALQRRLLVTGFIADLAERARERIDEDRAAVWAEMRRLRRATSLDQELFG